MQTANILLALGGDPGNTVPKYGVTASEIAVLNAIHGDGAVTDIEPAGSEERTSRSEVGRLRVAYGHAKDGEDNSIVDTLFPGAAARAFETLEELDLDPSLFKAITRAKPASFGGKGDHDGDGKPGGTAPAHAEGYAALTVPQLKALAGERGIDLGAATKKLDIVAAIEAADAAAAAAADAADEGGADDEDEDGVGEMPGADVLG